MRWPTPSGLRGAEDNAPRRTATLASRHFPWCSRLTDWGEPVQVHDGRDVFQASPDKLPTIDIHSM